MEFPSRVSIVEVSPRDGLQNESRSLPVTAKVALIDALAGAGLTRIECGSFVSPKWVPQMAGTPAVLAAIARRPGVAYSALVPNKLGLERALECSLQEVAVFVAASESFSKANLNCSIEESLRRAAEVTALASAHGLRVRGYISCALGCPYEGPIAPRIVAAVAERLAGIGCFEISLGDTIGVGTPLSARRMIKTVSASVPLSRLAVHFHDTYGQALANILVSLEAGVSVIDSSVAGLGGCPYAPGASGNVATEDVVYMLEGMNISTGVNLKQLSAAGIAIANELGRKPGSKVTLAMLAAGGCSLQTS